MTSFIPANISAEFWAYWRLRWVFLSVGWVATIIGALAIMMLPDRYDAMTRIYVETDNLLTPLLHNITIQADISKQIEVLQRTLLNRKNMESVAHSTDLDLDLHTNKDKDVLYAQLAKQIVVKAEGNNLFTVTYSNPDPQIAKKIVETLLAIFVETNLGQNRSNMESARSFIDTEIANYERNLKLADERQADFRSQHMDVLLGDGVTNFSVRLDAARHELASATTKVKDLEATRARLTSDLAATPQFYDGDPVGQGPNSVDSKTPTSTRSRITQLEADLSQLQARYTDEYPDVVLAKRSLEKARQSFVEPDSVHPAVMDIHGRNSNPLYVQIKLRLLQTESDLTEAKSRVTTDNDEFQRLLGLASSYPRIEAELGDLNREYGVIKAKYEDLLGRRESARLSEAAESRSDKIKFRIIESPQVQSQPSFPNRPLLVLGLFAAAMTVSVGGALLQHKIENPVVSASSLPLEFNVMVYGTVPQIANLIGTRKRQSEMRNFSLIASALLATYFLILALAFIQKSSPTFLRIDVTPMLQRIQNLVY